jgi:hypothetical protein
MKAAPLFLTLASALILLSCQREDINPKPVQIKYRYATLEEGKQLFLANTDYLNSLTQNDLDWKMRKTGTTLDQYKAYGQTCVLDFTENDKAIIDRAIEHIEGLLEAMGARSLPFPDHDIVFVKTNMMEEYGAAAYTHKTEIYIGDMVMEDTEMGPNYVSFVIAHELFHCLTRNSPEFRRRMYGLIGFTIAETDFSFSPDIRDWILANPDVEHFDNYATFTINGQKKDCILVALYTKTWEEAYAQVGDEANFFAFNHSVLIPIDAPDTWYETDDASDFWDVMGENTDYVDAAEECMANNFAFSIVPDLEIEFKSPWLLEKVTALLKDYK